MQDVCKLVKSKNLKLEDSDLIIDLGNVKLENDEIFGIVICQNIPDQADENVYVKFLLNNKLISLYNVTGNYTRVDQIKKRTRYPVVYGIDPLHISLLQRIYPSKFNYKNINSSKGGN